MYKTTYGLDKIVIIGAGITGMVLALSLAHHKIPSVIIERISSDSFPHDIRTNAFTKRAKDFLESIGVWQYFKNDIGHIKDIYVVDHKSDLMLQMSSDEIDYDAIGYIIENDIVRNKIYSLILENPYITLQKGVDIESEIQKSDNLFLVCEGRNSPIKNLFPVKINKDYDQTAIVLVTSHEKPHDGTAVEHFMDNGPFAILPMQDPCKSSIVWTETRSNAKIYSKMPKQQLEEHLSDRFGKFLGEVRIVSEIQTFDLKAYIVSQYVQKNLVLVGDIAHAIHPLAGQGLNQGLKDIELLSSIISKRSYCGLDIDSISLDEYEKDRLKDNNYMYHITDGINAIFLSKNRLLSLCRKLSLAALNQTKTIKHKIISYGMGIR